MGLQLGEVEHSSLALVTFILNEFQELGWLPGADAYLWDVTPWIAKESILGSILGGTIGFDTTTSIVQFSAWGIYLIAVLIPYLSKKGAPAPRVPAGV